MFIRSHALIACACLALLVFPGQSLAAASGGIDTPSASIALPLSVGGVTVMNLTQGAVSLTGNITISEDATARAFLYLSDARLKEGIADSPGLAVVEKLRGVTFQWKKDHRPSAGVIAQEVEKVLPSAVHTNAQGIKSVEYNQLIAPIIQSIKELKAENDDLRREVERLKQQK